MLNLVNQTTHIEAHCDFTSNDSVKKLQFCHISKGFIISCKSFCIHQYLIIMLSEKKVYMVCSRKKKQAGWLKKCLCKYSIEVSRSVLEILENRSSLQV